MFVEDFEFLAGPCVVQCIEEWRHHVHHGIGQGFLGASRGQWGLHPREIDAPDPLDEPPDRFIRSRMRLAANTLAQTGKFMRGFADDLGRNEARNRAGA